METASFALKQFKQQSHGGSRLGSWTEHCNTDRNLRMKAPRSPAQNEAKMLSEERNQIALRRSRVWGPDSVPDAAVASQADQSISDEQPWNLVGLAISGGGIRSATFGLGVLQGLASLGILRSIDYLSTVSGGGYVGSWFAAWVKHEGSLENVEKQLNPKRRLQADATRTSEAYRDSSLEQTVSDAWERVCVAKHNWQTLAKKDGTGPVSTETDKARQAAELQMAAYEKARQDSNAFVSEDKERYAQSPDVEPEPIFHLRRYSNYLSPSLSLFSGDSWTLIAIYLRNLLANQLCLLPVVLAVLLIVRLVTALYAITSTTALVGNLLGVLAMTLLIRAFVLVYRSLRDVDETTRSDSSKENSLRFSAECRRIITLLAVSSPLICWLALPNTTAYGVTDVESNSAAWTQRQSGWEILTGNNLTSLASFHGSDLLWFLFVFVALHGVASLPFLFQKRNSPKTFLWLLRVFMAACGSGAAGGALLYLLVTQLLWKHAVEPAVIVTWGPSLGLLVFAVAASVEVVLMGRHATESVREWWA